MAGSNGSSAQRGAQIPQQWPPETEEQARAREYERWLQEQRAQQAYEQQVRGHAPPAASYPDPAGRAFHGQHGQHGHPHPGPGGPVDPHGYGHPGGVAPPFGHAPAHPPGDQRGYAPHFERFDPGPPPSPQDGFARYEQQGYAQSPQRPAWDAGQHSGFPPMPAADPGRQAHSDGRQPGHYPELPGLPGYPAPPQDYDHRQGDPRQDLRSYDLSNYAPGQIPHGYGGDQAHPPQTWPPGTPEPRWDDGRGQWPPQDQPGAPGPEHAGQGYAQTQHDPRYANVAGGQEGYDHEEAEAVEERRGPSTLVIVGALVGAIIAGGGLAYGYKMLGGGGGAKVKVAEIKAPTSPAKTKPKDPGGKTIEHSDKTFVNRASSDSLPPVPTSLNAEPPREDGAPRKVATTNIVLNRDGSVTPQVSRSAEPPVASSATGVPGLLIDGLNTPPPGPAPGRAAIPPPPPPAALPPPAVRSTLPPASSEAVTVRSAPPPPPPRVADLPLPKVQAREAPPPRVAAPERQPVPKRAAVRDDLPALKSGGAATAAVPDRKAAVGTASGVGAGAAANANGYVAVLASKRNRQEALNSFADIFQKHPDVLAGRTPDVREVNLADKGVWYRLIVGPPGSREAARDLCVKLKARGMADCWPTAY